MGQVSDSRSNLEELVNRLSKILVADTVPDSHLSRPEDPEDLFHNIEWLFAFRRMGLAS